MPNAPLYWNLPLQTTGVISPIMWGSNPLLGAAHPAQKTRMNILSRWFHRFTSRWVPATKHDVIESEKHILMKVSEMVPILNEINTELGAAKALLAKIDADITRILEANPDLPQAVVDALTAVQTSAAGLVTDATAIDNRNPEPETPPVTP